MIIPFILLLRHVAKSEHVLMAGYGRGGTVYRFNMDGGDRKKFYEDQGAFAGIALCTV